MDEILGMLLKYDDAPPHTDYSPTEFGESIANGLSDNELRSITFEALCKLLASLASSFLVGLLESRASSLSPASLYDAIKTGRQVDTAGVIVHILVGLLGEHPDSVVSELLRRLAAESEHRAQDRLAYGLWVIYNGETLLVCEGKTVGFLVQRSDYEISEILAMSGISPYTREALITCL